MNPHLKCDYFICCWNCVFFSPKILKPPFKKISTKIFPVFNNKMCLANHVKRTHSFQICQTRQHILWSNIYTKAISVILYTLVMITSTFSPPRWQRSRIHTRWVSFSSSAVAKISSERWKFKEKPAYTN